MPEPEVSYRQILGRLNSAGIRYVVIGGVAMYLHGANNLTLDIDIAFARDRVNTDALARLLSMVAARPRGFEPGLPFVLDGQTLRNSSSLTLETSLGDFDLLAEPEGVDRFDGLWERATVMEIEGEAVRVAAIDDLIAMKRAAGRPKDQSHLLELLALKRLTEGASEGPADSG